MGLISSPSILAFVLPEVIVEALDTFGAPKDWHLLALEMPFQAGRSIHYCRSRAEHASLWEVSSREKLPQAYKTATLPGRYIRRHWPGVSDAAVRDLVAKVAAQNEVVIVRDMAKMLQAVSKGPYSCMAWSSSGCSDQPWYMYDADEGEERRLNARIPLLPGGAAQLFWRTAMSRELAAIHRVALPSEGLRDVAHLHRRAAEAMHEKNTGSAALDEEAAVRQLLRSAGHLYPYHPTSW